MVFKYLGWDDTIAFTEKASTVIGKLSFDHKNFFYLHLRQRPTSLAQICLATPWIGLFAGWEESCGCMPSFRFHFHRQKAIG